MPRFVPAVRLVVVGGALSYRALFNWATPPMFVGTLLVAPAMQMVFFLYLGRQLGAGDDRFYIIGNAVLGCSTACVYGCTMAIANERRFGTLGAVLLSPRNRILLWLSRALPYIVNGMLISAFTFAVGDLLFGLRLSFGQLLGLVPVLLVAAASCSAFGLVLGAVGVRFRDVFLLSNLSAAIMLLVTGTNVPRSVLPAWLADVGSAVPLTHAIEAARAIVSGAPYPAVLNSVGMEAAVGVGYAVLAVLLMRYFEASTRRHAAVDTI
jgi:ABC-2 type transport system permease protein